METLKKVLIVNAISSGATGLLLIFIPGEIATLFAAGASWPFTEIGIFLVLFAAMVMYAGLTPLRSGLIRTIIALDTLWVVASLVLMLTGAFSLSGIGYLLTGAVAAWVALMAILQFKFHKPVTVA
ncbi:hypothetical protein [Chitinophaga sp. Cy-1792]|uniref:hypothetical protein n=1 Tax=Chitinophaga sp. Cy-1792 TaxID=2608339 RepID=UPI00141E14CA|nr:hypothetical protein [Chitinophaga sp. Cy-1792]NIG54102.1 hypothetical protein [Chitinophaga sp. Cy-1792]